MNILLIFLIALGGGAFFTIMRYNLHMLQLNGYKNKEHGVWLKKNAAKQNLVLLLLILGIVVMLKDCLVARILLSIAYLILVRYYLYLKNSNVKKKLVFTKRVKRLIITNVSVVAVVLVGGYFLSDIVGVFKTMNIVLVFEPLLLLLANVINKPIEQLINNHFIDDAKKKLKQVPDLKIIGVTGSYGKTSVKYYLETLLKTKYNVLITPESYNTPMGVVRTIRESLKSTHEIFVCEMGARYVGDIKEICEIVHPNHGVITSIGPQHLETFINLENIIDTKFELADSLPEDGKLFLNCDNSYIREKGEAYPNRICYNTDSKEGYYVENVHLSQSGTEFDVISPCGEKEKFQTRLIGVHNVINILAAITISNAMGISLADLRVPVRRIQPVEHRMQMLKKGNVTIIDDAYNSNPIGSKAAVETLNMFEGVRILITPGMVELGEKEYEFNYKFGTYAAKCCDYILLVGKERTQAIQKGALDSEFSENKCIAFDKLDDALAYAYGIKDEGHKYILLENDLPDNY